VAKFSISLLGSVWAFALPLINILVFWFVFQVGLRNGDITGVPFIVWYVPAYLIWTFFQEALISSTNSIREYSYLVKKVYFPIATIPVIKIISSLIIHVVFILFIMILNGIYHMAPTVYYFQAIYYVFCTVVLSMGLGWLFSSISCIIPDMANVVNIFMQLGFWATPIIWNPNTISPTVLKILKTNPMFYVTEGYRQTFLYHQWFWEEPLYTIYFWIFTVVVFAVGYRTFIKLQHRFADYL
jgi:teichoic acid transport system permease protein